MTVGIEFIKNIKEKRLPLIKLTKSRNGKTGTATFIFIEPFVFSTIFSDKLAFDSILLVSKKERIQSNDLSIVFKQGKPFLLKAIFIFKNPNEWFLFLSFMREYSKQTGLSFSEK